MKTKAIRVISILGLVVLFLLLGTAVAGSIAKSSLAKRYPAPGRLVDVGGYKMHINCTGQGSPTVVLEAGMGDYSLTWAYVQPEVANYVRVCSYDRAGYGWSEPGSEPRNANSEVAELHTLLNNANVEGPYVLVGHSLGGMLVRMYAHKYPNEVLGMVLVDSFHEERLTRNPELKRLSQDYMGQIRMFSLLSSSGIMALVPQFIPNQGLPEDAYAQFQAVTATRDSLGTLVKEANLMEESSAQVRALGMASFGTMPMIVLSAGRWDEVVSFSDIENQELWKEFQAQQAELAALSSESKQIIAEQSGHQIQVDQPALVIDAIREMVDTIRK